MYKELIMIHQHLEQSLARLNSRIESGFLKHKDDRDNINSHFFENRFENIFISREKIPELGKVFEKVKLHASDVTGEKTKNLRLGYWFNFMRPGERTLPHTHDEADELLSCVYYVSVPDDSGLLYLGENENRTVIKPREALMVFFPPTLVHHVDTNNSTSNRLSIGFNIGAP
jgi:hypothetical protein